MHIISRFTVEEIKKTAPQEIDKSINWLTGLVQSAVNDFRPAARATQPDPYGTLRVSGKSGPGKAPSFISEAQARRVAVRLFNGGFDYD